MAAKGLNMEKHSYECGCGFNTIETEDKVEALRMFIDHYGEDCDCSHHANTDPMRCHECGIEAPRDGFDVYFKVMISWRLDTIERFDLTYELQHINEKYDFDLEDGGAGSGMGMRDEDWGTKYRETANAIFDELVDIAKDWPTLDEIKVVRITSPTDDDDFEGYETETLLLYPVDGKVKVKFN